MRFFLQLTFLSVLLIPVVGSTKPPPAWPVRINLSVPIGSTFGGEKFHGFTWGLRGTVHGYFPPYGPGFGVFGELLLDGSVRNMNALGLSGSVPVFSFGKKYPTDLRLGAYVGFRRLTNDADTRAVIGIQSMFVTPAYLYDLKIGLRADVTMLNGGITATTISADLDLLFILIALTAFLR